MPDWVYCATNQQVSAENTAALLREWEAIWCMPEGLHGHHGGYPEAGDRLWLVWRPHADEGGAVRLLGGGIVMPAPEVRYGSPVLWTNTDLDGVRVAAEDLGYGGGNAMSFLRLHDPQVLAPDDVHEYHALGAIAAGPNVATGQQIATLGGAIPL